MSGDFQAKKSEDLEEVTHKVFFDVEIDGKSAGKFYEVGFTDFFQCLPLSHLENPFTAFATSVLMRPLFSGIIFDSARDIGYLIVRAELQ